MSTKKVIGISTIEYSASGSRTLYVEPGLYEQMNTGTRRATRTKTLDGGAVVYDAGFSYADQTWSIKIRTDQRLTAFFFAWLVKTYGLIRITTEGGVYTAVPSSWAEENGVTKLEALVMERVA
jgi:hypothetical protein